MAEGLNELWSKLSLSEVEDQKVVIDESDLPLPKNILIGRFVMKRSIEWLNLGRRKMDLGH